MMHDVESVLKDAKQDELSVSKEVVWFVVLIKVVSDMSVIIDDKDVTVKPLSFEAVNVLKLVTSDVEKFVVNELLSASLLEGSVIMEMTSVEIRERVDVFLSVVKSLRSLHVVASVNIIDVNSVNDDS